MPPEVPAFFDWLVRTYADGLPATEQDEARAWIAAHLRDDYALELFHRTDYAGIVHHCIHHEAWSTEPVWKELFRLHGEYVRLYGEAARRGEQWPWRACYLYPDDLAWPSEPPQDHRPPARR